MEDQPRGTSPHHEPVTTRWPLPRARQDRGRGSPRSGRLRSLLLAVCLVAPVVVATAPAASAVETRHSNIQLRGAGGNCLTADALGSLASVTMRPCGSVPSSRQNWNVIRWGTGLSIQGGLALSSRTDLCLGTAGNSSNSGTKAVLQSCSQGTNPSVQWNPASLVLGTPGDVRDYRANRCLDVAYAATAPGTPVWLYNCNSDSDAQTWMIGAPTYIGPMINNRVDKGAGSMCLAAPSPLPGSGDRLGIMPCDGSDRQRWVELNGYFMLGGKCLDIRGPSSANQTPVQMFRCVNVPQQRWREQNTGVLKSDYATVCLDVANGATAPGSQVWSYACNASHAQGWYHGALPTQFVTTGALAAKLNGAMAARLASCAAMLHHTADEVHFVAANRPAAQVFYRSSGKFSEAARAIGAGVFGNRAAINGQWFDPAGGQHPFTPQGDIWVAGHRVNTNPYDAAYHGYNITVPATGKCGHQWSIGPQNNAVLGERPYLQGAPSDGFAMGGARPLIIAGSGWGPGTGKDWPTREKWAYYNGTNTGKTSVGVRGDGMVAFMVQRDMTLSPLGSGRSLTDVRTAYSLLGFKDAVLFDSGASATLAHNGQVLAKAIDVPGGRRDDEIPNGLVMGNN